MLLNCCDIVIVVMVVMVVEKNFFVVGVIFSVDRVTVTHRW